MPSIALVIEFDGTCFVGWQIQDNGRSVQEEIQRALTTLYKEEIKVTGSSRTDAGVHARGLVCSAKAWSVAHTNDVPFSSVLFTFSRISRLLLPVTVRHGGRRSARDNSRTPST